MLLPMKLSNYCARCYNKSLERSVLIHQTRFYSLPKMNTDPAWKVEKERILSLPLEEKRKLYKASDFIIVDKVDPWKKYVDLLKTKGIALKKHNQDDVKEFKKIKIDKEKNQELFHKVSIFKGDITKLEVDAIVNAANSRLIGGGGVDGAIHRAAGPFLQAECNSLGGCPTGEAKVTEGYNLPAKYVIHTVGPQDGSETKLQSCYENCLSLAKQLELRSIAFPCISTGIYNFPNRLAAHIALRTARKFLEHNDVERIIFCTFMPVDVELYETLMQSYFPPEVYD
ncbi:macro domain-containing protein PG1779-like [Plodia interpunctella]|uniref:macro domain-containing protein PG1779-like n=1 Tax=Plodia interpunctella TaxID=58824 RepID=UPI002367CA92|nr:macro domain-containing protein RSc0334-like [Plodia interpunctella]